MYFQRLRLRRKAQRPGGVIELADDAGILQLDRSVATIADQERHRMLVATRVVAGDEGIDRLEFVDEAIGQQEIERAIHGRWCGTALVILATHAVKQVVRLDRRTGAGNQVEDKGTRRRQPQPAFATGVFDRTHERLGVMDVVARIGAGVLLAHGGDYAAGSIPMAASMRRSASSRPHR